MCWAAFKGSRVVDLRKLEGQSLPSPHVFSQECPPAPHGVGVGTVTTQPIPGVGGGLLPTDLPTVRSLPSSAPASALSAALLSGEALSSLPSGRGYPLVGTSSPHEAAPSPHASWLWILLADDRCWCRHLIKEDKRKETKESH